MNVKLILFDADGVLFRSNRAISDSLAKRFSISGEDISKFWMAEYPRLSKGAVTTEEFVDILSEQFNIPRSELSTDDLVTPYKTALELNPGIEDLLEELAKKDLDIALLSDTSEPFHESRKNLDIFKHFDKQFLSFETGQLKPDNRSFQKVIDHYHLSPGEIFFIDDSPANIAAAKELGMQGVVFEDTEQLTEVLKDNRIL
ncbi:MAG TPA: HAD family phosphatase [Candidatus Saccharimonadales bacterium]|nr:HAD family phosphatase [Candidatus Saccharimonadales bacterium]